jgi:hypothetical protein
MSSFAPYVKSLVCAAGAMTLSIAGQAHAIVAFSIGAMANVDPGFAPGEHSVVNFDDPAAADIIETDSGLGGAVGLFTTTHVDLAAAPVGDTTLFQAIQPGGSAKFDFTHFTPGVASLSVYVGSIDAYNMFEVSTNRANYLYDGTDFIHNNGDQLSHLTNRRLYFQFTGGEIFKAITLSSAGITFEYDSFAAEPYQGMSLPWSPPEDDLEYLYPTRIEAVPEPASWGLMLLGLGMLGRGARGKRSAAA